MADSSALVGTWKLVSWEVTRPDRTLHQPYGRGAVGYLIYSSDGYMSAEIMNPDRAQSDPRYPLEPAAAQTLSDPDRARAYDTYLSYCGTYTVAGDTVTHHVAAGLIPSWTGSDQVRRFELDHDRLVIGAGNQKLIWERAVRHE
jgi:hypothetical protein